MLVRAPTREYRLWAIDSRRWSHYRPRPGDIIVATYPKCGTTWMQRIVDLLIHQDVEPRPLSAMYPWIDLRIRPIDTTIQAIETQTHRRALKSHLPFDGLPIYEEVFYIHVGRDGRDVAMSYHNHISGFTEEMLAKLDKAGLEDETIGRPYPRISLDPAAFFRSWLTEGAMPDQEDGSPFTSFFETEQNYWTERARDNLLLVHYNDLTVDLAAEMRRVARFLEIDVPAAIWDDLVMTAGFEAMRLDGEKLMPQVAPMFVEGARRFFNKGTNRRWEGVFSEDDLALYREKVRAKLDPDCARWLEFGRQGVTGMG